jgi:hypothetical protein
VELAPLSDAALVSAAVASVMGQILVARRFHWPWSLAQSPSTRPRSVGEVGKDAEVNAIFDEALGILGHAELWSQICCIRGHERPHRALTELFSHSGSEQPT